jgi:MoxR-like ATPase
MNIRKDVQFETYQRLKIQGKTIRLPHPVKIPDNKLIGRGDILDRALAAWTSLDGLKPLNFRLYGPPGVGKNVICYELARILDKDLYIINGHNELGPEDIACTATVTSKNSIEYVASPLFAAMYRGGILFFDEIGKAPQSALDPLASVLDDRRELSSVLAGIHLRAHEGFLFCAALNDIEEKGVGLPSFLDERTRPAIFVGYPPLPELETILKEYFPGIAELWIKVFLSEFKNVKLSPREAITLLGYASRMFKAKKGDSMSPTQSVIKSYLRRLKKDMNFKEVEIKTSPDVNEQIEDEIEEHESDFYASVNHQGSVH